MACRWGNLENLMIPNLEMNSPSEQIKEKFDSKENLQKLKINFYLDFSQYSEPVHFNNA